MITVKFDDSQFFKEINNILDYATGFVDGAKNAKPIMMRNISYKIKEILYAYIDSTARMEPEKLHHVYEWYMTGSPEARLYKLTCTTTAQGIGVSYNFSQSKSIKAGSRVPFYTKAQIMESGTPVTIRPSAAKALVFETESGTVFTKKPVTVTSPGGEVAGEFHETIKNFFDNYLSQVFLSVTGIRGQLEDISDFSKNFGGAKSGGYRLGFTTGEHWISKVGTIE